MQLNGLEFFKSKINDLEAGKVTITGSADFAFITWQEKNGALRRMLFLNDVVTEPEVLSAEVRRSWILRMCSLDYSTCDIAHMLGCNQAMVSRICREALIR